MERDNAVPNISSSMSLTALAVVSRQGAPLYLRDYVNAAPFLFNLDDRVPGDDADNVVGDDAFEETTAGQRAAWPCLLKYQFVVHSGVPAAGRRATGQPVEAPRGDGDGRVLGRPALPGGQYVRNASPLHARIATGYVTTNARYITLVKDSIAPEHVQLQTLRDNEICVLMVNVHRLYTKSLLNPFTTL